MDVYAKGSSDLVLEYKRRREAAGRTKDKTPAAVAMVLGL